MSAQLTEGSLICVPPTLIKRCKNHFHNLCGASIILGNNGYIWISSVDNHEVVNTPMASRDQRIDIARLRNCISALALNKIMIFDTTIQYTYDASANFKVTVNQCQL